MAEGRLDDLLDWLNACPSETIIGWSDDGATPEGLIPTYADVYVPMICEVMRWNWVWTVVNDAEFVSGEDDETTFVLDYNTELVDEDDGTVYPAWTAEAISEALSRWVEAFTGREDIRFEFNPHIGLSPFGARALQDLEDHDEE